MLLNFPRIYQTKRRPKRELDLEFEAAQPRILGALLSAVAAAIRDLDSTKLDRAPRMTDFAQWATAAEPGPGLERGQFINAYEES